MNRDGVKTKTNKSNQDPDFGFGMPRMGSLSGPRDRQTEREGHQKLDFPVEIRWGRGPLPLVLPL
jgi:hypothetical protein